MSVLLCSAQCANDRAKIHLTQMFKNPEPLLTMIRWVVFCSLLFEASWIAVTHNAMEDRWSNSPGKVVTNGMIPMEEAGPSLVTMAP